MLLECLRLRAILNRVVSCKRDKSLLTFFVNRTANPSIFLSIHKPSAPPLKAIWTIGVMEK